MKSAALQREVCSLTEESLQPYRGKECEVCSLTEERSVKFAALQTEEKSLKFAALQTEEKSVKSAALQRKGV